MKEATIIVPTVIGLYKQTDDSVATIGPGEVLHLEFAAPLAEQAAGSTRRFVVETPVWCKDTDPFTKDGDTVEPMPHQDNSSPETPRCRDMHRLDNTRFEVGR